MDRLHRDGVIKTKSCLALGQVFVSFPGLLPSWVAADRRYRRLFLGEGCLRDLAQMELARVIECDWTSLGLRTKELILESSQLLLDFGQARLRLCP